MRNTKNKENRKYILLTVFIASNLLIYLSHSNTNAPKLTNFKFKKGLSAIELPVKSFIKISPEEIDTGVHVNIKNREGTLIVESAYLFTRNQLSMNTPTEVTLQISSQDAQHFSPHLENSDYFYAFPYEFKKKGVANEVHELQL